MKGGVARKLWRAAICRAEYCAVTHAPETIETFNADLALMKLSLPSRPLPAIEDWDTPATACRPCLSAAWLARCRPRPNKRGAPAGGPLP